VRCTVKFGVGLAIALQGTACSVPPLWDATNNAPFGREISVDDVVVRVKCELADALSRRMDEKKFKWLESWTAKADLTLQVDEGGGITPSVSFTQPLKNAFNLGSGPSSVAFPSGAPGTSTGATAQNFSIGIGATYSGQVFRTETVSFALSLSELRAWREIGSGKDISCAPAGSTDLQGNLDLKSWIGAALVPVEEGDLALGIHPDPGSQVKSSPAGGGPSGLVLTDEEKAWIAYYQAAAKNASDQATKSAQQAWATLRQARRSAVLGERVKRKIYELANAASQAAMHAAAANRIANPPKDERGDQTLPSQQNAQTSAAGADRNAEAAALDASAAALAANPNAPIDSISHSLNFIVAVGGSVSPNWTLLQWKGPANLGSLASLSAIRTHTLSVALGSPAAGGNSEANRVLNNDAFRQAIQAPF
jgi:hypothetical protein